MCWLLVYRWLLVNFGVFEMAFRLLTPERFAVVLQYLIPWMIAYVMLGANLHGLMRPKDGKSKLWKEILINIILLAPWFYLWFPIYFARLYDGGAAMSFAGGGMIMMKDWLWSFPPTLTIVAVIFNLLLSQDRARLRRRFPERNSCCVDNGWWQHVRWFTVLT